MFLTAYILIWTLVIICYATFVGLVASVVAGIISFFANGCTNIVPLGCALIGIGGAVLMFFASIYVTKGTLKFTKKFLLWIKSWFVGKEK